MNLDMGVMSKEVKNTDSVKIIKFTVCSTITKRLNMIIEIKGNDNLYSVEIMKNPKLS